MDDFSLTFVGQQRRFAREDNVREYNLGENWPCGKRLQPLVLHIRPLTEEQAQTHSSPTSTTATRASTRSRPSAKIRTCKAWQSLMARRSTLSSTQGSRPANSVSDEPRPAGQCLGWTSSVLCADVPLAEPQWQKLWYDEDLVDEYYYVSQLFEPSWQPRIMV